MRDGAVVPGADVQSPDFRQLCFNKAWEPAVLNALKLLTRPEYWLGDLADIRDTVTDAHTLMGMIKDGCSSDCVNWRLVQAVIDPCDANSQDWSLWQVEDCSGCDCFNHYVGYATQPPVGGSGIYVGGFEARECASSDQVGGHICFLEITKIGSVIGNVITITWTDCLDEPHIETIAGDYASLSDIQVKSMCISSLAPFVFDCVIDGNWVCGSA
jgi:hypothetical protein